MSEHLEKDISGAVEIDGCGERQKELVGLFRKVLSNDMEQDDETFFKQIAHQMTEDLKELAYMIINFKKDLKSKISPEITDLAIKYIPRTTDQLEGVIETTEKAANQIMDNLETMQTSGEKMEHVLSDLKKGEVKLPGRNNGTLDPETIFNLSPVFNFLEANVRDSLSLISDTFVQMSFQDLTGQRIKRIMTLVSQMEEKLREMIISFGIKIAAKEKNPEISNAELQRAIEKKVERLAGPQREGQGLDQEGIDELLANL